MCLKGGASRNIEHGDYILMYSIIHASFETLSNDLAEPCIILTVTV